MNKVLKTLVVAIASFALIALGYSSTTVNAAVPYTDVKPGQWHYEYIDELHGKEIVFGYNYSNQFKPDQAANRGETAQFIANALGLDLENVKDPGFTDVPKSHPHYAAIAALANEGIVGGVGNNQFNPNGQLQRAHIAKILVEGLGLDKSSKTTSRFSDVNRYSNTNKNSIWITYIETLVEYEITTGKTPTTFNPSDSVTRAELTTFLKRTLDATDIDGDFEVIGVE